MKYITHFLAWIGIQLISSVKSSFQLLELFYETLQEIFRPPFRVKETVQQIEFIANQSLFVVIVCACFAAMVTILESSFHMKLVISNDSLVPGFAALLILRELGAIITGLLLTSRVGAGMTAEVATQKITEQIEALEMLGIRPINLIVVPRFLGSIMGTFFVTILANLICLLAAQLVAQYSIGFTFNMFLSALSRFAGFQDLILAGIKGAVFGAIIPMVSCYFGFQCRGGAEDVGKVTTQSVVTSSVSIILADFLLTAFFTQIY
jgi:phospholipid/cholesterol/gamma-HCH transport system permease protein